MGCIESGEEIGGYRVVRCVNPEGDSPVFEATRGSDNATIKCVTCNQLEALTHLARVDALVQWSHGNLVLPMDAFYADGVLNVLMESVHGILLDQVLIDFSPSRIELLSLLVGIAQGAAHLHKAGWVHGDIKPTNVLVDASGHARLIDFELARQKGSLHDEIAGTPAWCAPETFSRKATAPAADVYSLGLLIRAMFNGKAPCQATSPTEAMAYHKRGVHPPLRGEEADSPLSRLVDAMNTLSPHHRPDMDEVVSVLASAGAVLTDAEKPHRQRFQTRTSLLGTFPYKAPVHFVAGAGRRVLRVSKSGLFSLELADLSRWDMWSDVGAYSKLRPTHVGVDYRGLVAVYEAAERELYLLDPRDGAWVSGVETQTDPDTIAISPDGAFMAYSTPTECVVHEVRTRKRQHIPLEHPLRLLAINRAGYVAAFNAVGEVLLGKSVEYVIAVNRPVRALCATEDSAWLLIPGHLVALDWQGDPVQKRVAPQVDWMWLGPANRILGAKQGQATHIFDLGSEHPVA